ncbi:MAG: threonine/serine exporter family protein [Clostridium sp.]|nr:threonine/serine exporter family protein [Clostridium sp.]
MLLQTLAAIIASLGFGIIFNVKGKNLIFASLGGGLSWLSYLIFLNLGTSEVIAMFLSSIIFSIYSEVFARVLKTPVTTIVICCLIPLVPGAGMYNTMYEIITDSTSEAITLALHTLACAGSLALGVILVSTITRLINRSRRKLKYRNE